MLILIIFSSSNQPPDVIIALLFLYVAGIWLDSYYKKIHNWHLQNITCSKDKFRIQQFTSIWYFVIADRIPFLWKCNREVFLQILLYFQPSHLDVQGQGLQNSRPRYIRPHVSHWSCPCKAKIRQWLQHRQLHVFL